MRCDVCGDDKTGVVMVTDSDGRRVVCPDCARLVPSFFRRREKPHEVENPEEQTG